MNGIFSSSPRRGFPNSRRSGEGSGFALKVKAFSVIEMMVAVGIMSIIILVLYSIFNKTQEALRSNLTQSDTLEAGRAAIDLMTREFEEMAGTDFFYNTEDIRAFTNSLSFFSGTWMLQNRLDQSMPLVMDLPGNEKTANQARTNLLQKVFFLTRFDREWTGIGYCVLPSGPNGRPDLKGQGATSVGSLYRFSVGPFRKEFMPFNQPFLAFSNALYRVSLADNASNDSDLFSFQRIADGITHFKVDPYSRFGNRLGFPLSRTFITNQCAAIPAPPDGFFLWADENCTRSPDVWLSEDLFNGVEIGTRAHFYSNALPSYVEVELGVLEPAAWEQWRSILNVERAAEFIQEQADRVHIFRQRIPVRNAIQ